MIRLPPTQIGLAPDDLELTKLRLQQRRNSQAAQLSPQPAGERTCSIAQRDRGEGQRCSGPSSTTARRGTPAWNAHRYQGGRFTPPLRRNGISASVRAIIARNVPAASGTGLDGALSVPSEGRSSSDGIIDDHQSEEIEYVGPEGPSGRESSLGSDASDSNEVEVSDFEDADEHHLSSNITFRNARVRPLTSSRFEYE